MNQVKGIMVGILKIMDQHVRNEPDLQMAGLPQLCRYLIDHKC